MKFYHISIIWQLQQIDVKVIFVAKKIKLLLLLFVILSGFGTSSDSDRQKKNCIVSKNERQ